MPAENDESKQEPYFILTHEQADQLVTEALDTDLNEPEPLVRMLLILFDHVEEPRLADAIHLLMKVAYDGSIVHSTDFQEYLDAIRQGRNPLEEARAQASGDADRRVRSPQQHGKAQGRKRRPISSSR